jgi:polyisoprenoid-binding protein YceI
MLVVGATGYSALKAPTAASGPIQSVALQVSNSSGSATGAATVSALTLFTIQPGSSHASFQLDEVLRGEAKTVVGQTDQVSGQIAVNLDDPSSAQVGTILVNARTLVTDDTQRNNVISNFILSTDQNEYISFAPTGISGLSGTATIGAPQSVQLTGQLTIRGVSREVTFNATVIPVSASEIDGTANTTVRFADWGISIPSVPFVAGVSDTAQLQLTFVATSA